MGSGWESRTFMVGSSELRSASGKSGVVNCETEGAVVVNLFLILSLVRVLVVTGDEAVVGTEVVNLKRKFMSCCHCQELGQLTDLASDWLFTLV